MTRETVQFDQLVTDGVQTRVEVNKGVVKSYAKLMNDGAKFPALVVFRGYDENGFIIDVLVDGYTRLEAMKLNLLVSAEAEVTEYAPNENVIAEAILANIRLNSKSGFAMTNADKKNAVIILLGLFPSWSDRQVGAECGVDHKTVGKYRREIQEELHREATGEPKTEKVQKDKAPSAKELKAYIAKLENDYSNVYSKKMYAEAEKLRLEREINELVYELKERKTEEPKLSNNNMKKLLKLLHPDHYVAIEKDFPGEFKKIELAMKIVTAQQNENGGK